MVFVTDASQELTAPEVEFLQLAKRACPNGVCVMTKTDLYAEWTRIMDLDRAHLDRAGLDLKILPVSSLLRQVALQTEDKDTNTESGYPAVINYVRNEVVEQASDLARRSVLNDALRAVEHMEQPFVAEAQSLTNPEKQQAMANRLADAKADADRLKSQAARWQTTLSDGFGDLNSDVDQDLRTRMREVTRVAEEAIENSDPGKSWEEFRTWLNQRVTFEIVQNFSAIAEKARDLAVLVAEHFASEADEAAPEFDIEIPSSTLQSLSATELQSKEMNAAAVGFSALRGAYSNISMFTMAGNMVHMAIGLTNPVTIVIGLLSGGKAIRDVKDRELTSRRQQAKTAMRRYIDDVNFHVGKDFRDTIRHLQRELRETFSARAEEVQRSAAESLAAVQQGAQKDQGERQQRLQVLDAELKRLADSEAAARADGARVGHGAVGMSVTNGLAADVEALLTNALQVYAGTPAEDRLRAAQERLREPLRVAIAGKVKAGKSTLLNALVGEELAPTDAGECTRIVTWYRDGADLPGAAAIDSAVSSSRRSRSAGHRCTRHRARRPQRGRLESIDDRLAVAAAAQDDTDRHARHRVALDRRVRAHQGVPHPGRGRGHCGRRRPVPDAPRARGRRALPRGVPRRGARPGHPINAIGVLSRADELGVARTDAIDSARRIAERYRTDPKVRRCARRSSPSPGCSPSRAQTLREDEFKALATIAAAPRDETSTSCCSPPTASSTPTPVRHDRRRTRAPVVPVRPLRGPPRHRAHPRRHRQERARLAAGAVAT